MTQNTSHAVMAQRIEPHDSLDDFPTPPWATRALLEQIDGRYMNAASSTCWEPACNRGSMAKPLMERFKQVTRTDVYNYGWEGQQGIEDFLMPGPHPVADWIITNPPFKLAERFALRALDLATVGVAIFARTVFLESVGRLERLFGPHPPTEILQFSERVVLHKGKLSENGSTATAYCWVVWQKYNVSPTRFAWISPCRKRLEKPGDYD